MNAGVPKRGDAKDDTNLVTGSLNFILSKLTWFVENSYNFGIYFIKLKEKQVCMYQIWPQRLRIASISS